MRSVASRGPANSDADGPDPDKDSLESTSPRGSLAGTSPKQADAFDGISDLPLHGVNPNAGDMVTSHMPQGPVHASPASNDHSCNAFESYTPEGYTTDVSSTGSPTPANVSCCSGSGATAKIAASTSQYESDQALEALPPTKEQAGARSDAESDKMASEVVQVGGSSSCEDTPQDCSLMHVMETPDDVTFEGSLHGMKGLVKGYRTAAGPCLWRNTAIGVSLAIRCAAALVFCQMNAKQRPQH